MLLRRDLMVAIEDIDNFEDQATWDLISSGRTKGVFQLESRLGSSWAKRSKPRSIEELADLVSIIRPGTLEAVMDGKSMTKHYTDRKAKIDQTTYLHPALEPILNKTYGIIVYQEQAMRIATDIAGFSPEEADSLRKAMGKKDAALMKEVREKFINGSKNKGIVGDSDAAQIFDWIQASARYSFNKSHAVAYAINSFRSAYCKAHDTLKFYETYLNHAEHKPDKQREIKELIMDARLSGIEVYPPRLEFFHRRFTMNRSKNIIYFGYSNVKNVGEGEQEKLASIVQQAEKELNKTISEFNWLECLFFIGNEIKKNAFISIISVGGLTGKNNKLTRNKMLFEFDIWNKLTAKEQTWIIDRWKESRLDSLEGLIKDMINGDAKINARRLTGVLDLYQALQDPAYSLEDNYEWIADIEQKLMGCSLSCAKVDSFHEDIDTTCKEIANKETNQRPACIAVKLNQVKEYVVKKGQSEGKIMGFISAEDHTGECDSFVVFSDDFSKYRKLLFEGNTVLLYGEIKQKESDLSFIVKNVTQI